MRMKTYSNKRLLISSNILASTLAVVWAYSAYKYNCLNVGGGESEFKELWILASGVLPYMAIGAWLASIGFVLISERQRLSPVKGRGYWAAAALSVPPVLFFIADWFFHLGFPPPQL